MDIIKKKYFRYSAAFIGSSTGTVGDTVKLQDSVKLLSILSYSLSFIYTSWFVALTYTICSL